MMTGDNDRTASVIAKQVGVDHYYAEVLPEDKANFVEQEIFFSTSLTLKAYFAMVSSSSWVARSRARA